jgi:hypothetical protein
MIINAASMPEVFRNQNRLPTKSLRFAGSLANTEPFFLQSSIALRRWPTWPMVLTLRSLLGFFGEFSGPIEFPEDAPFRGSGDSPGKVGISEPQEIEGLSKTAPPRSFLATLPVGR